MYDNCFDEDGNPNYLKMGIYMLMTPKYLTNLSIILFILAGLNVVIGNKGFEIIFELSIHLHLILCSSNFIGS